MHAGGAPATTFVGRRSELSELSRLLRSTRLLTITGAGGSGKTRLARALIARRRDVPVVWADLAELADPLGVAPAIERALGARGDGTLSAEILQRAVGNAPWMIVLDNCEHLLAECRATASRILGSTTRARVIATSRIPLRIPEEVVWQAPGLSLPTDDDQRDAGAGLRSDAVRLFVERARSVAPTLTFDRRTVLDIAAVCRRLDGLPLAIELAASRLRHMPLGDLAQRIGSIEILANGDASVAHHRTMTSTIEWSHAALDENDRIVLRRVSVFPAGFTLAAAEAAADHDVPDVLGALISLVDGSLLEFSPARGRYRLLLPIRQFAIERLREHREEDRATGSGARHIAALASVAADESATLLALDLRIREEFANALALMPWLIEHDSVAALRLLVRAADRHRTAVPVHLSSLRAWLDRALSVHGQRDRLRAEGLDALARVVWALDRDATDGQSARSAVIEALSIAQNIGSAEARDRGLFTLGALALRYESRERALAVYDEIIPDLIELRRIAFSLSGRAVLHQHLGDPHAARRDLDRAFEIWDTIKDPQVTDRTVTMISAAEVAFAAGDLVGAEGHLRTAIGERASTREAQESTHFDFLAHIAAARGEMPRALRLAGIADRLHEELGTAGLAWYRLADRSWLPRTLEPSEALLVWEGGRLPIDTAVRFALGARVSTGLTEREAQVAQLVANGLTDKEIGDHLGISDRTAQNHIQRVRNKLGLRSRAQVVRWVVDKQPAVSI